MSEIIILITISTLSITVLATTHIIGKKTRIRQIQAEKSLLTSKAIEHNLWKALSKEQHEIFTKQMAILDKHLEAIQKMEESQYSKAEVQQLEGASK